MSHSAEFLRGRVSAYREVAYLISPDRLTRELALLAQAEARETAPNAAAVIAQCKRSLSWIVDVAVTTATMENEAKEALAAITKWEAVTHD